MSDRDAWSPYDAAVPHTTGLPEAAATFADLRARRSPGGARLLDAVRDVVVVASSSRGGSSLFAELLRRSEGLLHLRAELNPLFVVAGLAGDDRDVLATELAAEVGTPAARVGEAELEDLALTVAWRLTAQWPALGIDPDDAVAWVRDAVHRLGPHADHVELHLDVLAAARERLPEVRPAYYDLPAGLVAERFPGSPAPAGPPGARLVEMPPFVLVRPWRRPQPAEVGERPLILSTPRNAFRLPFLRSLFPAARFRVLHLTRNPAASVNGLVDGWLHHGFFNVDVGDRLRIDGYSDHQPVWGRSWWCYDVLPDWEAWTHADLAAVCGEQWRAHHAAVLDFLAASGVEHRRVRFEDVLGPGRGEVLTDLGEWLGVDLTRAAAEELPPVMATAPPSPRRWRARAALLAPVLGAEPIRAMADALGHADPSGWV
jgi:hypothetical protein